MKLVNTTPHAIQLYTARGRHPFATLPAATDATLVRVASDTEDVLELETVHVMDSRGRTMQSTVRVARMRWGDIIGLPPRRANVAYIVSTVVASAAACSARGADDLLVPQDLVRDAGGQIIGCRLLARAASSLPGLS